MGPERESEEQSEIVQAGRQIVDRIRTETNAACAYFAGGKGEDVFRTLYLTERDDCVPDHLTGDDLLIDIQVLYSRVFEGICDELEERFGREQPLLIFVDPSYDDTSAVVLCTHEKVLLLHWSNARDFYWRDEGEMARELGRLYAEAASRLASGVRPERKDGR